MLYSTTHFFPKRPTPRFLESMGPSSTPVPFPLKGPFLVSSAFFAVSSLPIFRCIRGRNTRHVFRRNFYPLLKSFFAYRGKVKDKKNRERNMYLARQSGFTFLGNRGWIVFHSSKNSKAIDSCPFFFISFEQLLTLVRTLCDKVNYIARYDKR